MAHLVGEFYPVIRRHYRDIAGTTGTANTVRQWLPMVKPLGQGPASGEHSPLWRAGRLQLTHARRMTMAQWDPFQGMEALRREIDKAFEDFGWRMEPFSRTAFFPDKIGRAHV